MKTKIINEAELVAIDCNYAEMLPWFVSVFIRNKLIDAGFDMEKEIKQYKVNGDYFFEQKGEGDE